MCGRFLLATPPALVAEIFGLGDPIPWSDKWRPRFNIAPSQDVLMVRGTESGGGREAAWARWGLIPSWAKEADIGNRTINARSETADRKPAFRSAFKHRRCLIPADGFYEWQAPADGGKKIPHCIRIAGGHAGLREGVQSLPGLFAMAGLWERWQEEGESARVVESCTILTCDANEAIRPLHERMPVILPSDRWGRWLDDSAGVGEVKALCVPWPANRTTSYEVGTWVNSPRHDDPRCIEPREGS
ncbi:MAG: SOS response-associated peptidase [Phycisphaerae bacterium]|nr:SOS response-associated peptidase [Phycisphaerae bacterium]